MRNPGRTVTSLTIASLLASTLMATPVAAQRVEVGNAASVVGNVTLDNDQLRRPIDVERRQRIAWGDLIETGRNSQLQILLLDRSTFGIGARSEVRIDEYVYDPNEGRSVLASFFKGALRFFSGADEGENSAEVTTPAGRIGIRGTAIDMLVGGEAEDIAEDEDFVGSVRSDDDEATLVILRGPGANTLSGLTPGLAEVTGAGVTVVLDEPGLAAYIPREGAAPIGPFRISNAGLAKVQDEMAPRWARSFRDGGIPDEVVAGAAAAAVIGIILGTRRNNNDRGGDATGGNGATGSVANTGSNGNGINLSVPAPSPNEVCYDANGGVTDC
ncbi:FecR family protein [Alteraurantiacibacter aquimixticola]|uniref:FecR protein domain-containing protein n=1 Tax=Alteraurantiacibacter aquimixticola TaxID=2489173 RepID=A0A4T3F114_9SPHN|nr:FecR domain-containing protein [Alteraurantiacibacter aquimixticola]TIX50732.1 hypothetical protein E5222_10830 [Alteraurantiacibacter aquimixticola]